MEEISEGHGSLVWRKNSPLRGFKNSRGRSELPAQKSDPLPLSGCEPGFFLEFVVDPFNKIFSDGLPNFFPFSGFKGVGMVWESANSFKLLDEGVGMNLDPRSGLFSR